MKDEKIIEEMAETLRKVQQGRGFMNNHEIAEELIKYYQPKLSENSIVLSRKEYEKLNMKYISALEQLENKGKETAEKFYDKFNENISCFELDSNVSEGYKEGYAQAIADICGKLDETAIELGVDLKEYYGK